MIQIQPTTRMLCRILFVLANLFSSQWNTVFGFQQYPGTTRHRNIPWNVEALACTMRSYTATLRTLPTKPTSSSRLLQTPNHPSFESDSSTPKSTHLSSSSSNNQNNNNLNDNKKRLPDKDIRNIFVQNQQWKASRLHDDPKFFEELGAGHHPKYLWIGTQKITVWGYGTVMDDC